MVQDWKDKTVCKFEIGQKSLYPLKLFAIRNLVNHGNDGPFGMEIQWHSFPKWPPWSCCYAVASYYANAVYEDYAWQYRDNHRKGEEAGVKHSLFELSLCVKQ